MRLQDQMDMVGHQTIGPAGHIEIRARALQQVEIERIVLVVEESLLSPVSPLGDMMGIARKNEACGTGHGCSYADVDPKCHLNEKVGRGKCVCPGFREDIDDDIEDIARRFPVEFELLVAYDLMTSNGRPVDTSQAAVSRWLEGYFEFSRNEGQTIAVNGFRQAAGELSGQVTGADPLMGLGMVSNRAGAVISILGLIQTTSATDTIRRAGEGERLFRYGPEYFGDAVHCQLYGHPLFFNC